MDLTLTQAPGLHRQRCRAASFRCLGDATSQWSLAGLNTADGARPALPRSVREVRERAVVGGGRQYAGHDNTAAQIVDAAAYAQAVQDALGAAAAYYAGGTSPLDDDVYDRLVREIAACEDGHPDQLLPDSPTGKVAGGAIEGDVPHTVAMLSLDNVFSPEEFTARTESLARRIGHEVNTSTPGRNRTGSRSPPATRAAGSPG